MNHDDKVATATAGTILRGTVGSNALGLGLPGQDDRDEMAVFIPPAAHVLGLHGFDSLIQRDQPDGVRSQPGDLDLCTYTLRKFCALAAKGNPSILLLLYLPEYLTATPIGRDLVGVRDAFYSRHAANAFLGYMTQQRERLVGERGQKNVKRPELVEAYGYDVKYAYHILRLGYQGIEYVATRKLTLPMKPRHRQFLLSVRRGEQSLERVLNEATTLEAVLTREKDRDTLPAEPDHARIDSFLVAAHLRQWGYL